MLPTLLVTNDDGVDAPGLTELVRSLESLGQVFVVAPDRERSAVSHALTLHSPLRAKPLSDTCYAIDGTPTDCVNLGIHGLLKQRPDLVVSGINSGGNVGDDITYSGTVAAAMEATLMGVPALAFSLTEGPFKAKDFLWGAAIAAEIVTETLQRGLPENTFLNINIPPGKPDCICITHQGKRRYEDLVVEKTDPRGRTYYWIGGGELSYEEQPGTDVDAVHHGRISVTPLHLDLTNHQAVAELTSWEFPLPGQIRGGEGALR